MSSRIWNILSREVPSLTSRENWPNICTSSQNKVSEKGDKGEREKILEWKGILRASVLLQKEFQLWNLRLVSNSNFIIFNCYYL